MEIESNTILCITPNMNVLQYPIIDEYHIPRSNSNVRDPHFAMRAGFHSNAQIPPELREDIPTESPPLQENPGNLPHFPLESCTRPVAI